MLAFLLINSAIAELPDLLLCEMPHWHWVYWSRFFSFVQVIFHIRAKRSLYFLCSFGIIFCKWEKLEEHLLGPCQRCFWWCSRGECPCQIMKTRSSYLCLPCSSLRSQGPASPWILLWWSVQSVPPLQPGQTPPERSCIEIQRAGRREMLFVFAS